MPDPITLWLADNGILAEDLLAAFGLALLATMAICIWYDALAAFLRNLVDRP